LTAAVERVDIAHAELNARIDRVEGGRRATQHDHPLAQGRGRHGDNDTDQGGDLIQTSHKLEFSKYDDNGDPLLWLNCCKRYFHVCQTPEHKRVAFATFYLLNDAQLWFHRMKLNGGRPT
jgi:hypothetical protein